MSRDSQGLFFCQRNNALEIIDECGLLGSKPAHFSMEINHKLTLLNDLMQYKWLVGGLIYLTLTKPKADNLRLLGEF